MYGNNTRLTTEQVGKIREVASISGLDLFEDAEYPGLNVALYDFYTDDSRTPMFSIAFYGAPDGGRLYATIEITAMLMARAGIK